MTAKIKPYLASSCCPICGVDTPHSHTRRDLTIQFRAAKLRPIFESRLERWWPQLKQNCYGSYGQAPILTHKKSGFHQAQGLNDEYIWPAVQMLWEVFMYIPCFEQPPLPAEGVPDINEALSIKEHPFAAHAPKQEWEAGAGTKMTTKLQRYKGRIASRMAEGGHPYVVEMNALPHGEYVLYADVSALEAENERLRNDNAVLRDLAAAANPPKLSPEQLQRLRDLEQEKP